MWLKPPNRLIDNWLWYVVKALYGMRELSKAFQEVVREMHTTNEWTLLQGASAEGTILRRNLRWSEEGVHMAPDGKHVENLASFLEVKGAKPSPTPSSRATGRGQRDVLELLTTAEATVFRRGTGIDLYLGPDRFDLQFATKELAQDVQTPSKLSIC